MTILVPVLGDQLSHALASLRGVDRGEAVVVMAEVWEEATYVRHHKKKIALVFSAMRHFAEELRQEGWTVDYVELEAEGNTGSLCGELERATKRHRAAAVRAVAASEYRVRRAQSGWGTRTGLSVEILDDDRFLCSPAAFRRWAGGRGELRMEFFYRDMRRHTGLLMQPDGKPVGGRWNFDMENRKVPPRGLNFPAPERFAPDPTTRAVLELVGRRFGDHFGELEPFGLPVTRAQALVALEHFIEAALPDFGRYQDAMVADQDTLFHSNLSACLNLGLLGPLEVARAAVNAFEEGAAPLNSVEGFVRQVIGWREYVRGMYWLDMPVFAGRNALCATRPLPEFFWSGETEMRCIAESVGQTRREAYAHHIQRLMVLGNFALLAGIDPQAVSDWFLVVYSDAFEWVEVPNVVGMSQFADGGAVASKPYASSGAYLDRMSNYCGRCRFDVKKKSGPDACPFNALYWDFLARHEARFSRNPRMRNAYATWHRFDPAARDGLRSSAAAFLATLQPAAKGWARSLPQG